MLLLIVVRLKVLILLQIFYLNKYILKENGRLLFHTYRTPHCTKMLLRVSLLSEMGDKPLRKKRKIQPMHNEPGFISKFC